MVAWRNLAGPRPLPYPLPDDMGVSRLGRFDVVIRLVN